ncbi:MAG: bifunctional adenosylcobinamide kinase/adenosylcobinamide-phosphate guanylyltransferase [Deinococcus sp.]|uniref:bifunctional adenosylcobinamide kinase/adenosylcobinamide-phosphate guanylyltransferase n=1 Tax=Deinococcus sp. TaxID=47478 RepID=UPI0026DCDA45|nr:bifunctional adenosylcobinamide kinase/adenosylcobinamide-phosphate guanylyltransferase [Deinococcus sp.]MDO4246415.1 bifunctional adenosylcobinamide kinase/adenosylcobinamide-phosphate guanylyltransferase [Deinococcus sp.]
MALIFVTGGARSGKSSYAERLAAGTGQAVTYLATAQAFDHEMRERIGRHRADRPAEWITVEEPLNVVQAVQDAQTPTLLLDCLSVWVGNLMHFEQTDEQILAQADALAQAARSRPGTTIFVTNEVGFGIVPDNALARRYRDVLGWVNQRAAAASTEAYLVASGLPLKLK